MYITIGAKEPLFDVKVQDLKKVLNRTRKINELSLELYDTENYACYASCQFNADEKRIRTVQLELWVGETYFHILVGTLWPALLLKQNTAYIQDH